MVVFNAISRTENPRAYEKTISSLKLTLRWSIDQDGTRFDNNQLAGFAVLFPDNIQNKQPKDYKPFLISRVAKKPDLYGPSLCIDANKSAWLPVYMLVAPASSSSTSAVPDSG